MYDKYMLEDNMYLMDKGVRDCCELLISGSPSEIGDKLQDIGAQAAEHKYSVLAFKLQREEGETNECYSVFICKYNHQRMILTRLFDEVAPGSLFYEYIMGTLLGYSAAAMEDYLMNQCADEVSSIIENKKEEESPIKDQLSEFDKDAWQVLMALNNNCTPDSEKMNMLADLLYTHTDNPREKTLIHDLAVMMPDTNKPDFSNCIIILENCFHVDTEDGETDTSSADETFFGNDLWDLLDGFKASPSEHDHNLKLTKEFADKYWGKFDSNSPRGKLIKNLVIVLFSLETCARKSEIISKMLEGFYTKYEEADTSSTKIINEKKLKETLTMLNNYYSRDSKKGPDIEQYFGYAAALYLILDQKLFSEDSRLARIKKFIELTPPKYIPEAILYNKIKYEYHVKSASQEEKIEAVKNALDTYLLNKKKAMEKVETKCKGDTNESIDPYREVVYKLYNNLRNANSDSEFASILNKFLEKDACYKVHKNFQNTLKWEIENEYGKRTDFASNVLSRIRIFLNLGK